MQSLYCASAEPSADRPTQLWCFQLMIACVVDRNLYQPPAPKDEFTDVEPSFRIRGSAGKSVKTGLTCADLSRRSVLRSGRRQSHSFHGGFAPSWLT